MKSSTAQESTPAPPPPPKKIQDFQSKPVIWEILKDIHLDNTKK